MVTQISCRKLEISPYEQIKRMQMKLNRKEEVLSLFIGGLRSDNEGIRVAQRSPSPTSLEPPPFATSCSPPLIRSRSLHTSAPQVIWIYCYQCRGTFGIQLKQTDSKWRIMWLLRTASSEITFSQLLLNVWINVLCFRGCLTWQLKHIWVFCYPCWKNSIDQHQNTTYAGLAGGFLQQG